MLKIMGTMRRFTALPAIFYLSKPVSSSFYFVAKLVPVGYGIKKLQINAVIEDDKVSTDDLEEKITEFEDYVSLNPAFSVLLYGGLSSQRNHLKKYLNFTFFFSYKLTRLL